ncbi:hypothetical protein [Gandjariella thermophila]|uniref:Uncharacterized protein n=1 Tax=Gandjariella thermophila TaxID=1931992 RepID=A0A4D4J3E5_9PSEU|nr:hypothetical protein [Gandjariella thermophila]GDY29149.1 hypothetical protein GTS_07820 [Gandjariella thermophila]
MADVISLRLYRKNRLTPAAEPRMPEPAQLYALIGLALLLHAPVSRTDACGQCGQPWPCPQVRLACRLRDGF